MRYVIKHARMQGTIFRHTALSRKCKMMTANGILYTVELNIGFARVRIETTLTTEIPDFKY
jgi:hypothetical protein